MKLSIKSLIAIFMSVIFSGCSLIKGKPTPPVDIEKIAEKINSQLENIDSTEIDSINKRNSAIDQALVLIDLRYAQFINNAGLQKRSVDMATDFVQLSLNLAGTAVGGAGLKTLLSALSAGISGTELGFDKTFVYEKTVPALVMQMNADRSEKRREIILNMQKKINSYSWSQAVSDLMEYYNVGTLQSAISSIKKNAGSKQTIAEKEIKVIKKLATSTDVATKASLTSSLNKIDAISDKSEMEKIKTIFAPISQTLEHLPNCKRLDPHLLTTQKQIKDALQECIRDIGYKNNSPLKMSEELAILEYQFKKVNLLTN